jgi:deoxyguanosine kinase
VIGRYIAVEGPIGVGKAALVQALTKRFKASLYLDAPNPFLPAFYEEMEKYAFQVQLYFLLSRFQQQRDLAQGDLFASTAVCDYLFQKDRLFASLTLGPAEFALYEKVYSLLKGTIATPDVVVYLQADVDTLLDRLSAKEEGLALLMPKAYLTDVLPSLRCRAGYRREHRGTRFHQRCTEPGPSGRKDRRGKVRDPHPQPVKEFFHEHPNRSDRRTRNTGFPRKPHR